MNKEFEVIIEYLPVFLPVIIIELALALTALIHVLRHPQYRFGNRTGWILAVLLVQIVGPILYFTVGKGEEQ